MMWSENYCAATEDYCAASVLGGGGGGDDRFGLGLAGVLKQHARALRSPCDLQD